MIQLIIPGFVGEDSPDVQYTTGVRDESAGDNDKYRFNKIDLTARTNPFSD